jgi:hypothetical protein
MRASLSRCPEPSAGRAHGSILLRRISPRSACGCTGLSHSRDAEWCSGRQLFARNTVPADGAIDGKMRRDIALFESLDKVEDVVSLVPPSVMRRREARSSIHARTTSRSAVPVACVTSAFLDGLRPQHQDVDAMSRTQPCRPVERMPREGWAEPSPTPL